MGRCDLCGRDEDLPFRCRYCGGQFCADHRLPPNHRCVHEDRWWFSDPAGTSGEGSPPQALPVRECALCGAKTSSLFFCPSCGNEYCAVHRLPGDHGCRPLHDKPPAVRQTAPEKRRRPIRNAWIILLIGAIIVAGLIGYAWIGHMAQLQTASGYINALPSQKPAPAPALTATLLPTTVTTTLPPAVIKVPPVIRVTPSPTPLAGVISYPHIVENNAQGIIVKNYTFRFQNRTVTISAGVNRSVYNGAKNSEKTLVTSRKDISRSEWAPGYFLAFVNDYHQEKFYTDLISSFRKIRREMGLSDDEYLELMAVFVQSLDYDTAAARNLDSENRFPVETFVDGKGVCGDKSLLLAALLSWEGYDVNLLLFDPEKHMAVGVRSTENGYRNTSYAFLETTRLSYVGVVPDRLAGNIVLSSMPILIPVGSGWKEYSSLPQTRYIEDQSQAAQGRIEKLEAEIKASGTGTAHYNELVDEHNRYVSLYNYINSHEYDRPGTYSYVTAHAITVPGAIVPSPQPSPSSPAYALCDPAAGSSCPAGSRCCESDHVCYAPCQQGVWVPDGCVCRVQG
jgi:hypothetical protein